MLANKKMSLIEVDDSLFGSSGTGAAAYNLPAVNQAKLTNTVYTSGGRELSQSQYKETKKSYLVLIIVFLVIFFILGLVAVFVFLRPPQEPPIVTDISQRQFQNNVFTDRTTVTSKQKLYVNLAECPNTSGDTCLCPDGWFGDYCFYRKSGSFVLAGSTTSVVEPVLSLPINTQELESKLEEVSAKAFIIDHQNQIIKLYSNLKLNQFQILPADRLVAGPHLYTLPNKEIVDFGNQAVVDLDPENSTVASLLSGKGEVRYLQSGENVLLEKRKSFTLYFKPNEQRLLIDDSLEISNSPYSGAYLKNVKISFVS